MQDLACTSWLYLHAVDRLPCDTRMMSVETRLNQSACDHLVRCERAGCVVMRITAMCGVMTYATSSAGSVHVPCSTVHAGRVQYCMARCYRCAPPCRRQVWAMQEAGILIITTWIGVSMAARYNTFVNMVARALALGPPPVACPANLHQLAASATVWRPRRAPAPISGLNSSSLLWFC
jgi:hypothetical protein